MYKMAVGNEGHEVKKREKLRCLLLRQKRFFYIFDVITWEKEKKRSIIHYY
jgi:hypothetical protein